MLKTLSKPRWSSWEGLCVKAAFEQKVQLKIIATALQKSVNAVSKKIKTLGLRGHNTKPGRLKGEGYNSDWNERTSIDLANMLIILKTYAPLSFLSNLPASETFLLPSNQAPSLKLKMLGTIVKGSSAYSLSAPLSYELLEERHIELPGIEKGYDNSVYVPFCYIEKWALLRGFQYVAPSLQEHGMSYWRGGRYFSKAQVLLYLNGLRLQKKLPPISLCEEKDSHKVQKGKKPPSRAKRAVACKQIHSH